MSVVLYSGSLSGFFLEQWRSALPVAEAPTDDDEAEDAEDGAEDATPDQIRAYFQTFRDQLTAELRPHLAGDLSWDESTAVDEKVLLLPDADFAALMLIAARAAIADKRLSPIRPTRPWFEDPAVEELHAEEADFLPVHHLVQADSWLPADFALILPTEVPDRDLILGSLPQLQLALTDLRKILLQPSEVTRKLPRPFVDAARQALQAFTEMAAQAAASNSLLIIGTH